MQLETVANEKILALLIITALIQAASAEEPAADRKSAIELAIPGASRYMEKEALSWKAEMGCATECGR